jgi:hypothetical protein
MACGMAALAVGFSTAHAAESARRFYVGVLYGESTLSNPRYKDTGGKIVQSVASRQWVDQTSKVRSISAGFSINPFFAVEAGYWNFGEGVFAEHRETNTPVFDEQIRERFESVETSAKGYAAGIVASYPWKNWKASAKIGALKHELTQSGSGVKTATRRIPPGQLPVTTAIVLEDSFDNTTAFFGAALGYTWANRYALEVDWRTARHLGDQVHFDGLSVKSLGIGAQFRF